MWVCICYRCSTLFIMSTLYSILCLVKRIYSEQSLSLYSLAFLLLLIVLLQCTVYTMYNAHSQFLCGCFIPVLQIRILLDPDPDPVGSGPWPGRIRNLVEKFNEYIKYCTYMWTFNSKISILGRFCAKNVLLGKFGTIKFI
jgi:hypothetical protein